MGRTQIHLMGKALGWQPARSDRRTYTGTILALSQSAESVQDLLHQYLAVAKDMNPRREVSIRAWLLRNELVMDFLKRVDRQRLEFAKALCRRITDDEQQAGFFGEVAHLCIIGAQQTTQPLGSAAFSALLLGLFELMRQLTEPSVCSERST